ncbi:EF-hand domain-containing protein [Ottowia thiooxydans]|uniref:EF-hand domain-containing protein n=1 Tax=Ottowia thiooxydans TaxID=219182 RepID=UPI000427E084|nr:EF-hand domain-containing protein [Ottowia thiooxydans]
MSFNKVSLTVALAGAAWVASAGSALAQPKTAASAPTVSKPTPSPSKPVAKADTTASANTDKGDEQALKWFRMLDSNGDGRLSRDETAWITRFKPSVAEQFNAADANRDGYVTQDEIRALAKKRRVEREANRKKESPTQAGAISRVSTQ